MNTSKLNMHLVTKVCKSIYVLICHIANRFVLRQGPLYKALDTHTQRTWWCQSTCAGWWSPCDTGRRGSGQGSSCPSTESRGPARQHWPTAGNDFIIVRLNIPEFLSTLTNDYYKCVCQQYWQIEKYDNESVLYFLAKTILNYFWNTMFVISKWC